MRRTILWTTCRSGLVAATLAIVPMACGDSPAGPEAGQRDVTGVPIPSNVNAPDVQEGIVAFALPGVEASSTLRRRENGFSATLRASGLPPNHAVTLWAIELDPGALVDPNTPPLGAGRLAGGIVGGSGQVNLAGNNCLDELIAGMGKVPGKKQDCDLLNPAGFIVLVLLVGEEPWEPGDQALRWSPGGKADAAVLVHPPLP